MSLSVAEISSVEQLNQWDKYVAQHPDGTFTQLNGWAELKQQFGWNFHVLVVYEQDAIVGGAVMMDRSGALGLTLSYVPYGPLWNEGREDVLRLLLESLRAESAGSVALRVEPHVGRQDGKIARLQDTLKTFKFENHHKMTQPEATLMLDLSKSEDELMAGMRQTTRRYIRQAERAGLIVEVDETGERLEEFYAMLQAVDERKHFGVHTLEYYSKAWKALQGSGIRVQGAEGREFDCQPYLFFVKQDDRTLGAYFLTRLGDKSWELYGGVTEAGMKLKANYLLKWHSIRVMKQAGVVHYDQWGVAPRQKKAEDGMQDAENQIDRSHHLAGVTYFKEGYGGERVEYSGSWDQLHRPLVYRVARMLKKI